MLFFMRVKKAFSASIARKRLGLIQSTAAFVETHNPPEH